MENVECLDRQGRFPFSPLSVRVRNLPPPDIRLIVPKGCSTVRSRAVCLRYRAIRRVYTPGSIRDHVRLVIEGEAFSFDVGGASVTAGSVQFTYLLARDGRRAKQIETIQRLEARLAEDVPGKVCRASRMARLMAALRAWDARMANASLKDIAADLLKPGDWPGPAECRKSAARRLVTTGGKLVADGPRPILAL